MNKILKISIWTICIIAYLGLILLSFFYNPFFIPAILILILFGVWRIIKYREKKSISRQIPAELLKDLETAGRIYERHEGRVEPHKILWAMRKAKLKGGKIIIEDDTTKTDRRRFEEAQSGIGIQPLSGESFRRENIPNYSYSGNPNDTQSTGGTERVHRKFIFRKRTAD
jgi:hypothetical protein